MKIYKLLPMLRYGTSISYFYLKITVLSVIVLLSVSCQKDPVLSSPETTVKKTPAEVQKTSNISAKVSEDEANSCAYLAGATKFIPVNVWVNKDLLPGLDQLTSEEVNYQINIIRLQLIYGSQEFYNRSGNNLSYGLSGVSVLPFFYSGFQENEELFWKMYHMPKKEFINEQLPQIQRIYDPYKKQLGDRLNVVLFETSGWKDGKAGVYSYFNNLSISDCSSIISQTPTISTSSNRYVNKAIALSLGLNDSYAEEGTIMSLSEDANAFSKASGLRIREAAFYGVYEHTGACQPFSIHQRDLPDSCDELYNLYAHDILFNPLSICVEEKEDLCRRFGFENPSSGIGGGEEVNYNPFDHFEVASIALTKQKDQTVKVVYTFTFQYYANYAEQGIDLIYADGLASWSSPKNQYAVRSLFYEQNLTPEEVQQNKFFRLEITKTIEDYDINFEQPIICGVQLRYRKGGVWYKRDFGTIRLKLN